MQNLSIQLENKKQYDIQNGYKYLDNLLDEIKPKGEMELLNFEGDGEYYHKNYLNYLALCWNEHRGIVINPTILWNIVLNEIARHVNENSEEYRELFTEAKEGEDKTIIEIRNNHPTILNVAKVCEVLKDFVPTDMSSFLPSFSTDTENSKVVLYASFMDAVSSYYEYRMTRCGIPFAKIYGTDEDWTKFNTNLMILTETFPELELYFNRVSTIIFKLNHLVNCSDDTGLKELFSTIYRKNSSMSGRPATIEGWITDFYIDNTVRPINDYPTGVCLIEYSDHTNPRNIIYYKMTGGLLSSDEKICEKQNTKCNKYLEPKFGYIVYKDLDK